MSVPGPGPGAPARQLAPLPRAARVYLALVILAAAGLLLYWLRAWQGPYPGHPVLAVLLILLAALAQHFPLRLSPRYHVDASSAVYFAALLLLGAPAAMALAGASQLVGGYTLWLRRDPRSGLRRRGLRGVAFNTAQQMLATGLAGLAYYALLPHTAPASLDRRADLWALPLAGLVLYLANTGAVATMVGLQQRRSPLDIWRAGWREDLLEAGSLALLGLAAALLAAHHAWALLLLALPLALLHVALQRALTQLEARQAAELARAEAEAARRGAAYLAGVSAALAASLDYPTTLQQAAELAVQDLGDWCSVVVVERGGTSRRVAIARAPDWASEEEDAAPAEADDTPGEALARVLQTGQAELYPELTLAVWAQIAPAGQGTALPSSALIVPLVARGRTLGALSLAGSARRYGPADLALAADLAGRAALAVDNARLFTEAHEALAARDRFLAVAAHELRTPVTRLKAQAELLRRRQERGQLDAARLAVGLVAIDDAANHFVRLTRDLLDVSRLRAGQLPLRHRPLDLAALVRAVAAREGTRLGLGDRLRLALPDDLPASDADPDRLDQVFANLLENATKYSPEGGAIEVSLRAEGGGLLLRVRDSGIGLPPGATEAIFTPFERAANATARRIPGLGLGLSICRDIAVRHGGRLWAESEGEGQGTTMLLWLPASSAQAETAGAEAAD